MIAAATEVQPQILLQSADKLADDTDGVGGLHFVVAHCTIMWNGSIGTEIFSS